eukprot:CAMPEP_0174986000 /NCGR_PEP_ID=MMETSP0004_2-20121128/18674_1 /TAXON_ID=420556 /ORGANISM="Ochromonas sp., Strain CCMP1393" /LENGTH=158 /DNA_ID=CAMNT_0016238751 /DNA_START=152 /DNA_END=628 /DNA_ORIENTATION=-
MGSHAYYDVSFRCWPVDLDTYFHINNSCYFRVAELARWRIFPQSNMYTAVAKDGIMFLATEQTIKYFKPIGPFKRYIVRTHLTSADDKWFYYNHRFLQHPDEVKGGNDPIVYSEIECKAVLKERSGKTVKISKFLHKSPFYEELLQSIESGESTLKNT